MANDFWFKFRFKDWINDTKPLSCTAKGILIELVIYLKQSIPIGIMPVDIRLISRITGCTTEEASECLTEFKKFATFDFEETEDGEVLKSRRILKENHISIVNQSNGKNGGNPALISVKASVGKSVNRNPNRTPYSNTTNNSINKKGVEKKIEFFPSVTFTEVENEKLKVEFGDLYETACRKLSNSKLSKGTKYKSDYHAMHSWVKDAVHLVKPTGENDVYKSELQKIK